MDQLNGAVKEPSIDKDKCGFVVTGVSQKGKSVVETGEGESSQCGKARDVNLFGRKARLLGLWSEAFF